MDNLDQKVYSKEVIEFTAVANEYCAFIESSAEYNGLQILSFMQKLLPLLYSKTISLPSFSSVMDEDQEKYVNESDWQSVHDIIIGRLGEANDYLEVFQDGLEFSEGALPASIAENLADMFQDLKDFLVAYSMGTVELMNDALWMCQENFNLTWGQKLLNSLRAIHNALGTPEKIGSQDNIKNIDPDEIDTSNWIISKRQEQSEEELDD